MRFDFGRKTTKPIEALLGVVKNGRRHLPGPKPGNGDRRNYQKRADEIDAAIQVAVSQLTEITLKSTYFFHQLEKC